MKAIRLLLVSFLVICVSTTSVVAAKSGEADKAKKSVKAKIKRAIKAAPKQISDQATIMDADGTVLREGSNGWTCFPGVPLIPGDRHPMCNDEVWMEWLAAVLDGRIFLEETDPERWTPGAIGYSYMLRGDALVNNSFPPGVPNPDNEGILDQEGPHLMMLFPHLEDIALLPRSPHVGGPYVMWDGTPLVHVMVPLTDK